MMGSTWASEDLPPAYELHRADSVVIPASSVSSREPLAPADPNRPLDPAPKPPGPDEAQSPPEYAIRDPDVRCFTLQAPFISAAPLPSGSTASCLCTPRFQLSQLRSSLGKPYKLSMRRLTTTESRRASLALSSSSGSTETSRALQQRIDFDDDLTVYEVSNTNALHRFSNSANVQIRGCKARTLRGHIELADLSKRSGTCRFLHLTRKREAAPEAAQAKMRKYGYRPEDEWNKKLLFDVGAESAKTKTRQWKDDNGNVVAVECGGDMEFVADIDQRQKEALLACWCSRLWSLNQIEWLADG